jgi:hypothetical protein
MTSPQQSLSYTRSRTRRYKTEVKELRDRIKAQSQEADQESKAAQKQLKDERQKSARFEREAETQKVRNSQDPTGYRAEGYFAWPFSWWENPRIFVEEF